MGNLVAIVGRPNVGKSTTPLSVTKLVLLATVNMASASG